MVGFVFTSVSFYEGRLTAYNGGTGVVFEYRGMDITRKLYELLLPEFRQAGIEKCVLEVLTTNEAAIQAYRKIGFEVTKSFSCFRLSKENYEQQYFAFPLIARVAEGLLSDYDAISTEMPSYLDSSSALSHNLANEEKIEIRVDGELAGYAIYQQETGRLSRFGIAPKFRRQGYGRMLMDYIYQDTGYKEITVLNVDNSSQEMIRSLEGLGFEKQLMQFEMQMDIQPKLM